MVRNMKLRLIGTDSNADIAVLKIKSDSILTPINIADSSSLQDR